MSQGRILVGEYLQVDESGRCVQISILASSRLTILITLKDDGFLGFYISIEHVFTIVDDLRSHR